MPELKIKATTEKGKGPSGEVTIDFPNSTAGLVKAYGEEPTYSRARASFVIDIQSVIRSAIKAGKKGKAIQDIVDEYKPGVKARGRSQSEKAEDLVSKLSDAEKRELFAKFTKKK